MVNSSPNFLRCPRFCPVYLSSLTLGYPSPRTFDSNHLYAFIASYPTAFSQAIPLPKRLFLISDFAFPTYSNLLILQNITEMSLHTQESLLPTFSSVQLLSRVWLYVTLWTAAHQASLSITNFQSPPKPMSIELVMPSNHLTLCRPLLLLPSVFPSIRVFSNESALHIRWPKYWSCSFKINPTNEHPGLISFRMDWLDLLAVQGTLRVFSNTTVQKHQFFGTQLSL